MSSTSPAERSAREARIDIVRGIAILVILVNHLSQVAELGGIRAGLIPTPTRYGWSTAAELFVMLSGYMVGLIYLRRPGPALAVWRRAGRLWLYDLALLALVLPLIAAMPGEELAFWRLDPFVADPLAATLRFAALLSAPRLLDILQLYIVLMLAAPIAIAVQRRSNALLIVLSVALYAAAQLWTIELVAAGGSKDGVLDRLAWQMLFFVPMALGAMRVHEPLLGWLDRHRWVAAPLLALFVAAAFAKGHEPAMLDPRHGLTLLRVGHGVLVLVLYLALLTLAGGWTRRQPLAAVAMVGRHSLDCFAAGVLLTYGLGTAWLRLAGGYTGYLVAVALGVAATIAIAAWRDRQHG
ncbi:OpgC domain-containing protein [uncultured Sphingomonas sp.]|uniref:OpgC domain-containing protein n=1 Tax=uncultured Sphingomonas sp. TaxID=158754 RepID=UPI0025DC4BA8|nr:OpgC domain-containing protein [uncultured Sphingomonas sp.]